MDRFISKSSPTLRSLGVFAFVLLAASLILFSLYREYVYNPLVAAPQGDVPDYEIFAMEEILCAGCSGEPQLNVSATTDAVEPRDVRQIAQEVRHENQEYNSLYLMLHPYEEGQQPADRFSSTVSMHTSEAAAEVDRRNVTLLQPFEEYMEDGAMNILALEHTRIVICRDWQNSYLGSQGEPYPDFCSFVPWIS